MSYTCRIFSNTGFNATNRPDKPSLLNSCSYTDLASMDILQDGELNSIRVNASYAQIKNADYAKVGDWYYAIIGRHMENPDTCTLALLPDYTLSAGAMFRGSFADVASALVRAFARARPAPIATFYKGNRVLVIETMEDENAYD